MTPKQKITLRSINDFIRENKYSPTNQEVANAIGYKDRQSATDIINRLCRNGYVAKMMTPLRNIVVTSKGRSMLRK